MRNRTMFGSMTTGADPPFATVTRTSRDSPTATRAGAETRSESGAGGRADAATMAAKTAGRPASFSSP
jgi:hypothetical protein